MANESNEKLKAVSIERLGEYDTLLKEWVTETGSEMIESMSINAVVSASEPSDQNENDVWLQEYT